jgi:hypothetical protein
MIKQFILLVMTLPFLPLLGKANMASPIDQGALPSTPFTASSVQVIREYLKIRINNTFQTAHYSVQYTILSEQNGLQIPFLFYASEYLSDFTILVDGVPVELMEKPDKYVPKVEGKFKDFDYFFSLDSGVKKPIYISDGKSAYSDDNNEFPVTIEDMLYFETDLSKGEHLIELNYIGSAWKDASGLVNEYSFRYALAPAKYWKSFGNLTVELDCSEFDRQVTTNLGLPEKGSVQEHSIFHFNSIPTDVIYISYLPKIDKRTLFFANLGPFNMALILSLLFALLHVFRIIHFRKENLEKRFSRVVIIGAILIPLIFVFSWFFGYAWIDYMIGEEAGQRGYTFLVILLYPFIFLVYFLLTWFIDFIVKRKLNP